MKQRFVWSAQVGFTLIELMMVIVIIGILIAVALPNFIRSQDRAKISSVKANMHLVQTMAETYSTDWGGTYPLTLPELSNEAHTKNYWKEATNPFTNTTTYLTTLATLTPPLPIGMAAYNAETTTQYFIYGVDSNGNLLEDRGNYFVLSNH